MRRCEKYGFLMGLLAALLVLSGCGSLPKLVSSPQELYSLPELPAKYTALNSRINEILGGGAEYAPPTTGTNIQSVQLVDLDGDGWEEAVAFFRNPDDEKPLKIYVFTGREDTYEQSALIEGSGTAIYSIDYQDLDGDGCKELAVGWKATADLQGLEVYALRSGKVETLLRTNYVRYMIQDLDQDQKQELVVLRADEEGGGIVDYYHWKEDGRSLTGESSARLSVTMSELSQRGRVTKGTLQNHVPALFVTGVTEDLGAVTDILALRSGELSNLVLSERTGVSDIVYPFCALYPMDINNDGLTEVPCPVRLPAPWAEDAPGQRIDWRVYDENGDSQLALQTYHCVEDGWYLQLPETWADTVYISRTASSDEAVATFYIREDGKEPVPFLRIAAVKGTNREIKAVRGNRFLLSRQPDTLYTAELLEANEAWQYSVTADQVRAAFSLIQTEWISGEN